jgi:hypothetical protein
MKTGRSFQRAIFVDSLRSQLDKAAQVYRKDELVAKAESYLNGSDGLMDDEVIELLVADGFDPVMASSCVSELSKQASDFSDGETWGFEMEDSYGCVLSSHDLGLTVQASSREEAWEKAEKIIVSEGRGLDRLTNVFKV